MLLFPREDELKSSLPGLRYPSYRNSLFRASDVWLKGKRKDDNTSGLWRVHDDLYDFTTWIDKHPGGSNWLKITKGTDITEAFEVHHISQKAELMLHKFHVRHATGPRNSPYTFKDGGFYRTLKSKARKLMSENPPGVAWKSMIISDTLLISSLISAALAAAIGSYLLATISGILLTLTIVSAHNFFHQKDNLRMYYFDLSFMPSRNWRVSHAMSHHLYTNTVLDLEISMLEPFLQHLPRESKPFWIRYGSWLASPVLYTFLYHHEIVTRIALVLSGYRGIFKKEDVIPFLVPLLMITHGGGDITATLLMWFWITMVSSFVFGFVGINAAHHHPEIFHDGDAPRIERDWGVNQLDTVRERHEITDNLFLVLVTFGDHCLHHLFPTVDHSHLHRLRPAFDATCKEFGIVYKPRSVMNLITGQFKQLITREPNPIPPGNIIN